MKSNTGVMGCIAVTLFALALDGVLIHKDLQSLSDGWGQIDVHPYLGPALEGFWVGLSLHLFSRKLLGILGKAI